MSTLIDAARERLILFDGGLGSELIKRGLPLGVPPETWNLERPEAVQSVHRSYFEAGSDVVTTNSLGGTPIKLAGHNLAEKCEDINRTAARLAVEAKPEGGFVAGSIGPTGKFLKPMGEFEPKDFEEAFARQARALAEGGVDVFIIETMYDLQEALCALRAVGRSTGLPAFVSMTFNPLPRGFFTLMGDSVSKCVTALEQAGAAVVGTNCTLDSRGMLDLVKEFASLSSLPVIAQPNAGQPQVTDNNEVVYSQSVEDYAADMARMAADGARFVGGCCGTNPSYIKRLAEVLKS